MQALGSDAQVRIGRPVRVGDLARGHRVEPGSGPDARAAAGRGVARRRARLLARHDLREALEQRLAELAVIVTQLAKIFGPDRQRADIGARDRHGVAVGRRRGLAAEHQRLGVDQRAGPERLAVLDQLPVDDDPRHAIAERVRRQLVAKPMIARDRDPQRAQPLLRRHPPAPQRARADRGVVLAALLGGQRRLARLEHAHHDRGRVIAAAALERQIDQPLRRARRALLLGQHLADLVLGHVLADPVAAQKDAVAIGERHHERRDLALLADAERVGQHAAEPRALARDIDVDPGGEQPGQQRVILGQLHRDAVPHQVRARIAGVREHQLAADDHRADQRRAHPRLGVVALGLGDDRAMRRDHAGPHDLDQLLARLGRATLQPLLGHRAQPVAAPRLADLADRERARDLTGGVPAHPVAHQKDAELGVEEVRVLIVVAHLPHMGRRSADDRGSPRHRHTLHPRAPDPTRG